LEVVELNLQLIIHPLLEEETQLHLHAKPFQLLQQVAEVEDQDNLVEDQAAEEFLFIHKQEIQEIHPLHHHHKETQEEVVFKHLALQLTEAEAVEATAVLEVMPVLEMMEHQEQEQRILLQDHL
jgi:hypothetical protein